MRNVIAIFVLLVLIALGTYAYLDTGRAGDGAATVGRAPVPVSVFEVLPGAFQNRVKALGTLRAWDSVDITASVAETIVTLHFDDGDKVAAGQLLVTLKQDEEQASLRVEQEVLREQQREVARLENLALKNQVAQTELDQRRTQAAISHNKIAQMKARINDRTIAAPFGGVLGLRQVSTGALVSPGQLIATLDDTTKMRLDFTLPATALGFLTVGQQVLATTPAFAEVFSGSLAAVDSRVDPVNRSVTARATFANGAGLLKPGMLMSVTLLGPAREALLVPEEALVSRGADHFVWRLDGAAAVRTEVGIGGRKPGWVEVTAGLSAGDQVVRDGVARLRGSESRVYIVDS